MEVKTDVNVPLRELFAEVAPTYERVNRVLTLGLDQRWRRRAARVASRDGGAFWLDVCSGTGDMAVLLGRRAAQATRIISLDFCPPMLVRARRKAAGRIDFVFGDVRHLPFPDASFDLVTISFATRNINLSRSILVEEFAEFRRILRPGGRFVNLETSQPRSAIVCRFFHAYVRLFVKRLGARISGSRSGYAYLASTIPRFYGGPELAGLLREAGFAEIKIVPLAWGAAAIHIARA